MKEQRGIKVYPDQPVTESQQHETGAQSIRRESTAIVAVSATEIELPEVRIPWWDTLNNVERVALIPAQSIIISPNPATQSISDNNQRINQTAADNFSATAEQADKNNGTSSEETNFAEAPSANNQAWFTVIALLTLGWIGTTWFLLNKLQQQAKNATKHLTPIPEFNHAERLSMLCKAVKANDKDMTKYLIQWAQNSAKSTRQTSKVQSIRDLEQIDRNLYLQAKAFEEQHYATKPNNTYDQKLFLKLINHLSKTLDTAPKKPALRPMYP